MSFEPSYPVLILFAMRNGVYLLALLPLGILKSALCRGWARWAALACVALCLLGLAAAYGPSALGLYSGAVARGAAMIKQSGAGLTMPLVASAVLGVSAVLRGARHRWVDLVHLVAVVGFFALMAWVRWV